MSIDADQTESSVGIQELLDHIERQVIERQVIERFASFENRKDEIRRQYVLLRSSTRYMIFSIQTAGKRCKF